MTKIGLGFRSEMLDWNPAEIEADFFEVAPENWVRRDRGPLYSLRDAGYPIRLHGVSLNLGGSTQFRRGFFRCLRETIKDICAGPHSAHPAARGEGTHAF